MKKALLFICMLAITATSFGQGTTTFSTAGTGKGLANYQQVYLTEGLAVYTQGLNLYPNAKAAFQVGGDTTKTKGVLLTRAYDTSNITGTKPVGLVSYFYRYSTFGMWTGARWQLLDYGTGLITKTYTTGIGKSSDSTVTIYHGLGYTPKVYSVTPTANNARVNKWVSANDTTIIIHTVLPPANADSTVPYRITLTK